MEHIFGGEEVGQAPFAQARWVVLPAPLERTVSYGAGTGQGPAAILRASRLRARRVQLSGNWWSRDCGALLGNVVTIYSDNGASPLAPDAFGSGGTYNDRIKRR